MSVIRPERKSSPLSQEAIDRLQAKLLETVTYLNEQELDKKASNASYNEIIKGAKDRIVALAKALTSGTLQPLSDYEDLSYLAGD